MDNIIYEIIGAVAGLLAALPSIPQIIQTIKSKNIEGLSKGMYRIRIIGGICWIIYGYYLKSWQMEFFNTIAVACSITMLILIKKYSKKQKNKKRSNT